MAKKQTRRSISVSRTTYERLKAFCETNNISMSQLVETRVNDFLGDAPSVSPPAPGGLAPTPVAPRPMMQRPMQPSAAPSKLNEPRPHHPAGTMTGALTAPAPAGHSPGAATGASPGASMAAQPMTSAAARFVVDPPPPIIKPRQETAAPKPAEKRPEQIFTF